jgi:hypothetical protein
MGDPSLTFRQHFSRAALYLVILISPVGAPLVGCLISAACPDDLTVVPDGPFALGFSHCGLPRPLEYFYQSAIFLPIVMFARAGPILSGCLSLLWIVTAIGIVALLVRHLLRALSCLTIERL